MSAVFSSHDDSSRKLRGLCWKETRQIFPLIAILVGVALLLMTIWAIFSSTSRFAYSGLYIPLILPALYAAGAGALLVGQEKEQKTLWWLASLPAPATSLIGVKFIVALSGLAVMWLFSWLLTLLASVVGAMPTTPALPFDLQFNYGVLHLNSLFILVCGFYTAWRLKNTFASLITLIPLSAVPFLVTQLGYTLRETLTGNRAVRPDAYSGETTWVTVAAILVVGWLAYRAAQKNLQPAEPQRLTTDGRINWLDGWRPTTSTFPRQSFRFPISSLVWQSIHHNRAVLVGIFLMLIVGVYCLAMSSYSELFNRLGFFLFFGIITGMIGVSWLGVFVFTGDGSSDRIRFLAERGTSPTQVWLGRHLIGVSVLSIALVLFAALSLWLLSTTTERNGLVPSVALITIVAGLTYSISQWTSQLLRILAASAFVAPVLSVVAIYWLGYAATELNAPLWIILVCGALPMAATWLLMRRYMDGHRGLATWLIACGTVLLVIVLPVIPLAIEVAQSPSVPASVRATLVSDSNQVLRSSGVPQRITLVDVPDGRDVPNMTGAEALQQFERRSFGPSDRLDLGIDDTAPATADNYIIEEAIALATYEKLRFESSPSDESAIESVGRWITSLTQIATRLRESRGWRDQNIADLIEIWLTQTLSSESFEQLLDRDFAREATELIADQQGRNLARRRAVLASANGSNARSRFPTYARSAAMSATKQWLIKDREREAITVAALSLIEAGAAGESTQAARRQLHELTVKPSIEFSDGPYSDRIRVGTDGVLSIHQRTAMYPGCHWYAPWEADAMRLASQQGQDSTSRDALRGTP